MVARVSKRLIHDVRKHEKLLKDVSNPEKRNNALRKANRLQVGGSLGSIIKRLFSSVLNGKIPGPSLSANIMSYMKKFVRSRNPTGALQQTGSGIFTALTKIVPIVLPLILSMFKKKWSVLYIILRFIWFLCFSRLYKKVIIQRFLQIENGSNNRRLYPD